MITFTGHDRHTRYFITDELEAYFHFWKLGFDIKYKPKKINVDILLYQMGKISNEYLQK